tara:strand:- start:49 stop:969 length:921 start_codon:yes stop_codon:yes gene_type:complete
MDIKYFGDNLIPGLNVKNVNAGVINPLMNAGSAVSQAYGQYGKNLRQFLGQGPDEYSQQFLAPKFNSGLETDVLTVDGKQYDMSVPEQKTQMNAAIDALQAKQRATPTKTGPRLDPNATEQYASNFKAGETNQDAMQDYFKGQKNGENLAIWAKQNPALAYKAYTKGVAKEKAQDQRDLMSDYRVMNQDVSKGEGFDKEKFDAIYGGKGGFVEVDIDGPGPDTVRYNPQAQAFKDNATMSVINTLQNNDIKPFVEGITLPNYAQAFNQGNFPDYKSLMESGAMSQLAENYGLTTNTNNYFDRMFGK